MKVWISPTIRPPSKTGTLVPGRATGEAGFTLLEVVAVLALLGVLMGLVVPGLLRGWQREQARASLRQLVLTLRSARSQATMERQRVRVFLDLNSRVFGLEGLAPRGQWPARLKAVESRLVWQDIKEQRGYIAFYGDGSSSGGYLAWLDAAGRKHVLEVEVITGRITLKIGAG